MAEILAAFQAVIDQVTPEYTLADEIKANVQKNKALEIALAWCT